MDKKFSSEYIVSEHIKNTDEEERFDADLLNRLREHVGTMRSSTLHENELVRNLFEKTSKSVGINVFDL